jgi:hypothetical protein
MSKLIDGESVDNNGVEVSADREPIAPEVLEGRRLRGFPDVDKGKTSGPVTLEDGSVLTGAVTGNPRMGGPWPTATSGRRCRTRGRTRWHFSRWACY